MEEVPDSVAINEAVELSKGYEEQETVSFINGILGSFMRAERGTDLQADRETDTSELADDSIVEKAEPEGEQSEGK